MKSLKRKVTDLVPARVPSNPYPILFLGEAPGEEEALSGVPFVGRSGWLIRTLCMDAGIPWERCIVTNTFDTRPVGNNLKEFFLLRLIICNSLRYSPSTAFPSLRIVIGVSSLKYRIREASKFSHN